MSGAPTINPDVRPEVRWEVLRTLAGLRDFCRRIAESEGEPWNDDEECIPVFGAGITWSAEPADVLLAIRECNALGEIRAAWPDNATDRALFGAYVWIKDAGYDRVRAHDLLETISRTLEAPHA